MNEHYSMAHGTAFFQRIAERQIVIIFQTHAAEHNHINFRLQGNPRQADALAVMETLNRR